MDKKDIYEHLAKIYLDASIKGKKKKRTNEKLKHLFVIGIPVIVAFLSISFAFFSVTHKPLKNYEVALVISQDTVKINFNFNPAKKEIYAIHLNKLNMGYFRALEFSTKKNNHRNRLSLRVEFFNAYKERSEVYIRNIPNNWHSYRVDLVDFKTISDWTEMSDLSFIVEEWNTKEKNGVVYIENVRLLR